MSHHEIQFSNPAKIGPILCGEAQRLMIIAGPCVLESTELACRIAEPLKRMCEVFEFGFVFKGSFDKANRTSIASFRGPGLDAGLKILEQVKQRFEVAVTTDFHDPNQAQPVAEVCDLLQIPAFLARQTDLLVAAANTGKAVNVKKGQFMAPWDMKHVVQKLASSHCANILVCERGTFFGYGQLVNDMRSLVQMKALGVPVVFDATHSVQQPSGLGDTTGGNREMVFPLARAATAVGIDSLFLETHPEPDKSPSDGPNMVPLDQIEDLFSQIAKIRNAQV